MTQKELFLFYNDYVKPLYCEIEAKGNELPVELLFEIHAAFDHLKRSVLDGESEEMCCKKAVSHLKRGALDAFKLKLKFFHNDCKALKGVDLELVDSGRFLPEMVAAKADIVKTATAARLLEGKPTPDEAFAAWFDTSAKIDDFYEKFLDQQKIDWAKRKTFRYLNKDTIRGLVIGLATGIVSSYIVYCYTLPATTPSSAKAATVSAPAAKP